MSLTTCLKKAGAALNAEDKAAILKAAAAYRKEGMKADEAGRKAVDERIVAVQGMLADRERAVAEGVKDTEPTPGVKDQGQTGGIRAEDVREGATHVDPGEAPEAATQAVVTEAIKTAAENRDRKPSEMRAELLAMVDEAIKEAPDYGDFQEAVKAFGEKDAIAVFTSEAKRGAMGDKYAPRDYSRRKRTFKIPGDGTFTVNNTVRQLLKFRKLASGAFAVKTMPAPEGATGALDRRGPAAAITNMIDEGDPQAAVDYAAARGLDIAEVLKGDKPRLGKIAGLEPAGEAVGEFEPEVAEAPAAQPEVDAAPAVQPEAEAPVSSREGQMRLAYRGSRIASLKMMNDQLRRIAPDEAWADSNIENAADLDALQDQISAALVRAQRGPDAENPLRAELEAMSGAELRAVMERMSLAGARMMQNERIAALLAEDPAEVRAAMAADAPTPQPKAAAPAQEGVEKKVEIAPMPAVGGIPREAAQNAHRGTSFVPEERAGQEQRSFMAALEDAWARAARIARQDEKARERITEVFRDVADGYRARYMRTLEARSRVMSSMIAGPARFPVERNRKRMETERKRAEEAEQYLARGIKRMIRAARGPIDNSPESELESIRLRLAEREETQETMKAANAALRKGDDAALEDLGFTAEQIAELKKGDFAGRKGFPDYRLTNNNAEIRRLRSRLEEAEARLAAAQAGPQETERAGVRIVEDAQDDRLRLIFDGKPSDEAREDLKANGFKWSPKNGAWQRALTGNARYAAQRVLDKHFPADDAPMFARKMRPEQRAANFDAWTAGADVVDRDAAVTRGFKTGEAVVVEAYHGTARPDRVGTVFNPKRATSGPMAFFTSDPALASSYAEGKEDTSIGDDYDGDYSQWFKVKTPGQRARDIASSWWYLTPEQREKITDLAPRVVSREDDDGNYIIELAGEGHTNGVGNYEYEYRKSRNPLRALVENWLASGMLFNEERDFLKVLEAAGFPMGQVEFDSPRAKHPFVYKTFIRMGNPLVTSDIPQRTMDALEQAAKRDRSRPQAGGVDSWDKNTRTVREWVAQLQDADRSTYAWTSIPDKVTDVLKAQGYDGIIDWSGKGGGDIVAPVYIPFAPTQIKSAIGNKGTFDADKKDILMRRGPQAEAKLTDVQQAVDAIKDTWANPPEVSVVWDLQDPDVDEDVRAEDERQRRNGAVGTPKGFFYNGKVYIVASVAGSDMDVARTMFHESLGHAGLRAAFGDQLKPLLSQMVKLYRVAVENKAVEYGFAEVDEDGNFVRFKSDAHALRAAEEVLAELAETRPTSTWVKRAISAIRQWLRENLPGIFGDMELSDADIVAQFIVPARDAIVRGKEARGRDAVPRFMRGEDEPPFNRRTDLQAEAKALGLPATGTSERIDRLVNIAKADPTTWTSEDFDLIAPHLSVHQDTRDGADSRIDAILADGLTGGMVDSVGDMAGGRYRTWSGGLMGKPAYVFISGALKYQGGGNPRLEPGNKPLFAIRPEKGQDFFSALQTAMREKSTGGLPLFRRGGAEAGKVAAQDLINAKGGIFDFNRLGETKQDKIRTVIDGAREFWLGALTRDQIADVYGDEIAPVRDYDNLTRLMENERQKRAQDADKLYTEWSGLDEATNDKLGRIMLDATVYQVHPDEADPPAKADGKARMIHARIRREYEALPQEARDIYGKVKVFHKQTLADLQAAVEARIDRQVENGQAKAAALTNVRKMFDQYLEGGPYFPLSRFGDYIVIGKREDGEKVVAAYETAGEQQAAARALEKDGFTVKTKTAKAYSRQMDGAAGKFIGDVMQAVEKLDMVEATVNGTRSDLKNQLLDDLNQMFIRALPDLSYRKHFLHRKNTPGFSADVMRGFASSAFHAASHIARLNHGDQMTFALSDAYQTIESAPEGDFNKHVQVLNELAKRHDIALNPNTHPIASMLNQVGFVMYLGLSPAAGLVNLLQTPMVTLPHLGARYGFGKATASLGKATKDIMAAPMNKQSGWDATASDKLTADEKKAMAELQDEGIIDLTQAHDLAAASGLDTGNVARSKAAFAMARAMKIVGWTFHVPEVMNRQATALSAYRLEMDASGDVEKAKDAAREAIKRTHFDYSSSNRARYFQGNIARVVLQFKQYAQNMTYLLGRAAQQALQGETPEVRRIARRQLVATLGATWAMAGTLGLPALGAVMGAIGSMVDMLDDDDEPWDWKVEFRNLLADTFGQEAGEVIAHGLPRALMPWDVSGRVGMGELWFRSNDREGQSPREAYATDIANILGPTAGTALGWYTAADHMQRGAYDKAVEAVVPKFIRDPLKAYRESTEGVTTYTGEPAMETTAAEEIGRLLGFAPANVSEMYEAKGAVMNAKTAIEEKRETLLGAVVKARLAKDADAEREARDEIRAFNKRNPRQAITSESIRRSLRNRQRNRDNREAGILLPESQEYLRERGRFAVTQ